ncbi:hypothetical protein GCM10009734_32740 [Nonomuraea bangladeshensis]
MGDDLGVVHGGEHRAGQEEREDDHERAGRFAAPGEPEREQRKGGDEYGPQSRDVTDQVQGVPPLLRTERDFSPQ